jgi:outer membrane protein assembly factor BamB
MTGLAMLAQGADWPQWRGPFLNGASSETNLPIKWSKTENVLWSTPLPGKSGATPIVWGNSIFLPSPDPEKNLWLYCIDRTNGQVKWRNRVAGDNLARGKNNFASPSAVTDGERVISLFGTGDLAAFDFVGKELWHRNLAKEYGAFAFLFLYGSSPLLWEGKLYVQILQRNPPTFPHAKDDKPERESFILCLDPATGKTLWRHVRVTDARSEAMECYTTPMPFPASRATQLIVAGANCVTAHDLATGQETWRYPGINLQKRPDGRIVPSAIVVSNLVFACGPKRELLAAIRADQTGLLDDTCLAWKTTEYVPDVCTPLFYQGKLFVLDGDRQVLSSYRPDTGARIWQEKLGVNEIFSASPTGADGKLYCLSEAGTAVVLSAGDKFEVLATVPMGEGPCFSSIAVAGGHLFIRTASNLYCIGETRK